MSQIDDTNRGIDTFYEDQEALSQSGKAKDIHHYPNIIWGNYKKRKNFEDEIAKLDLEISKKQRKLASARGEVRVFEKLEEESKLKHRAEYNKQEMMEQEEKYSLRQFHLKTHGE